MPMRNPRKSTLATIFLFVTAASMSVTAPIIAIGAVRMPPMHAQILHSTATLPSYEVATIKPWDGTGYGWPLRNYIATAFNIPYSSVTRLIGPDWINKKSYVIRGKVPDSIQEAMKKMPPKERWNETRLMQQSLLAERFKLKAHIETREMPIFELVLAKGGSKMKEVPPSTTGGTSMGPTGQMNQLKGVAATIDAVIAMLMIDSEIDGRTVIDKTGLTGSYDIKLKWVPARLAGLATPGALVLPANYGPAPSPDTEGPSLNTALQEQLGLKLVPTKGPVEVLVIDNIELPTEN